MSLINCPECQKEISDKVISCSYCGYPFEITSNNIVISEPTKQASAKPKKKKIVKFVFAILSTLIVISTSGLIFAEYLYNKANDLYIDKNYDEAISVFNSIYIYRDSSELSKEIYNKQKQYEEGINLLAAKKYENAYEIFISLSDYKDAKDMANQAYGENFEYAAVITYLNNIISELQCYYIADTWSNAINSRYDDFNEEISNLINRWDKSGVIEKNDINKNDIDNIMISLQNPTPEYAEAYKLLIEMYGLYVQIFEQAKNPSGSLLTFNSTIKEMSSNFEKAYNQITIMKPNIKTRIFEGKDNIDIPTI